MTRRSSRLGTKTAASSTSIGCLTLQGSRDNPVQLAAVEDAIVETCRAFAVRKVRVESWQGLSAVQRLQMRGLPVEMFTPTAKTNAEEWPVLAQRLASGTIVLPPHARLREELLNLVVEVGPQGVKVIDRGRSTRITPSPCAVWRHSSSRRPVPRRCAVHLGAGQVEREDKHGRSVLLFRGRNDCETSWPGAVKQRWRQRIIDRTTFDQWLNRSNTHRAYQTNLPRVSIATRSERFASGEFQSAVVGRANSRNTVPQLVQSVREQFETLTPNSSIEDLEAAGGVQEHREARCGCGKGFSERRRTRWKPA